jgi:hypothetical protein
MLSCNQFSLNNSHNTTQGITYFILIVHQLGRWFTKDAKVKNMGQFNCSEGDTIYPL